MHILFTFMAKNFKNGTISDVFIGGCLKCWNEIFIFHCTVLEFKKIELIFIDFIVSLFSLYFLSWAYNYNNLIDHTIYLSFIR